MNKRRASSLIELLVLMSACSVILTLSAALLHRAMHIQSRARATFDAERSATRLARQFRQDVHRALDYRIAGMDRGEGELLQLTHLNKQIVQYAVVNGNVSRTLTQEVAIVAREEYAFPSAVQVKIQQHDAPILLALSITTVPAEAPRRAQTKRLELDSSPVSLQAEAVLGRDLRFARGVEVAEDSP